MERHHDLVASVAAVPGVEYRSLGQTLDGQEIDPRVEPDAVDELHGEVAHSVGVPEVVDGHDVRVLEGGRDLGFALVTAPPATLVG